MRIAPLADVKARLSAYLEECESEGPIVITRNGKAVAVLVAPADDDDLESLLVARSPRFRGLLSKSRASLAAGKGLSSKAFWKAVAQRQRPRPVSGPSQLERPNQGAAADAGQKRRRG
jgi:prevent-host-death family protein